ncbi:MAG: hypothetical protein J6P39_00220 [Oscillospiraceae bacterium]|nr:hypothetical protein [Oscillospiraceae bacterium]
MNKQEFIEKLEGLGYPRSEYIILSGGSMLLRGLRKATADIDLSVSETLAEALDLKHRPTNWKGSFEPAEDVELKAGMEGRDFDVVEGYQCQTLEDVLALKRSLMRPKDLPDIEIIEEYLLSQNSKDGGSNE